jgi:hypothetical protein
MTTTTHTRNAARTLFAAALLSTFLTAANAKVGIPVALGLQSRDVLAVGSPATVHVEIQPAAAYSQAYFKLVPSSSWQILDGTTSWSGSLETGRVVKFKFRAAPTIPNPESLVGIVEVPELVSNVKAALDPERMGGKTPERVTITETPESSRPAARMAHTALSASAANLTVHGSFTYVDDQNITHGVMRAGVQLINKAVNGDLFDQTCASGQTDDSGNFSFTVPASQCKDLFSNPDPQVVMTLDNDVLKVQPDSVFAGPYSFATVIHQDFSGTNLNFGAINITTNKEACHIHNILTRTHQFMTDRGFSVQKVTALWPSSDVTYYQPVLKNIKIETIKVFPLEADIMHEYGHHITFNMPNGPANDIPDYNNGICDGTPLLPVFEGGHCMWKPEKGNISWMEGFADYFALTVLETFDPTDHYVAPTGDVTHNKYNFEDDHVAAGFEGMEDKIEGVIAGILWDLTLDHDPNGPHLSFKQIFTVIQDYDPDPGSLLHHHPVSIHEYFDGMLALRPGNINSTAVIYREHKLTKPLPDLQVTGLQDPPTATNPGASFSVSNTVANLGTILANNSYTVRFTLNSLGTRGVSFTVGTRTIGPNMAAGASDTTFTELTLPSTMPRGNYFLAVCADSPNAVPEEDERNNCVKATVDTKVD